MTKLEIRKATLHRTKRAAQEKAKQLRRMGYRAEVGRSQKATQKRSPLLQWAVYQGQRRKGR